MKRILLAPAMTALMLVAVAPSQGAGAAGITPHVYSTTITSAAPAHFFGTWRLTVRPSTFRVTKDGQVTVSGSVKIAGTRITFHDLTGPLACTGAQATGTYAWRITGARLKLSAVKDPCAGRKIILTKPFTRVV